MKFLGIFLLSFSILSFEIAITRILSAVLYYHLAFLVISLSMLGLGSGGTWTYFSNKLKERADFFISFFALLSSVSIIFALILVLFFPFKLSVSMKSFFDLWFLYLICTPPFFFGGLSLSLLFFQLSQKIGRVYFFDLIGAGAGALFIVPLLYIFDAPTLIIIVAFLTAFSSFLFGLNGGGRFKIISGIITTVFICLVFLNIRYGMINVSSRDEINLLYQKWTPVGRVIVYPPEENTILSVGLSPNYKPKKYPQQLHIRIDTAAGTILEKVSGDLGDGVEHLKYDITSLAHHVAPKAKALIIGFGGGRDILTAHLFGFKEIEGVEINPAMKEIICHRFKNYSGKICEMENIKLLIGDGRHYVSQSPQNYYSLIQLSLTDSFAATVAGAYAFSENSLYTKEAFIEYFRHLEKNGILTISRFVSDPDQETLRALSLCRAVLNELNIKHFEKNIMLFKAPFFYTNKFVGNLMCKKIAFTDEEIRRTEKIATEMGFDLMYTPLTQRDNIFKDFILEKDVEKFFRSYPFIIEPPTDNQAFFFHALKLKDWWRALGFQTIESGQVHSYNSVFTLLTTLVVSLVFSLLFIFLPLVFRRNSFFIPNKEALRYILYFGFLGLGFMLIEISLIQRFSIFLGHPIYSMSIILFSLLLFSGIGSFFSGKMCMKVSGAIFALIFTGMVFWVSSFYFFSMQGLSISKSFLSILFLAPLGLFMGMPLPSGIRLLDQRDRRLIPWALGVNGITSTIGAVLALILYINFGFRITFLTALIIYLFAAFALPNPDKQ